MFGKTYTMKFVAMAKECGINDDDIVATATAFTVRTIVEGYKHFVFPMCRIDEVIVSGGGVHNRMLLVMLQDLQPEQKVLNSGEIGFSDDAKEALYLRYSETTFLHGISNNLPSATSADRPKIMGKLAFP